MSDGSSHNRKRPIADIKAAHHGAVIKSPGHHSLVNPAQFHKKRSKKPKTNPS